MMKTCISYWFLGAFTNFLKVLLALFMPVRASVWLEKILPLDDFYEIVYFSVYRKCDEKIQV
jgi:hypothetical protein